MGLEGETSGFHAEKSIRGRVRAALTGGKEFRVFYYNHLFKVGLMLLPVELALVLFFKPFSLNFSEFPTEGIIVLSTALICIVAVFILLLWRLWKPALIIQIDKLRYNHIASVRGLEVEWDRIEGVMEDEAPYSRFRSVKRLKIVYRKKNDTIGQIVLTQNLLHKGEQAFSFLKKIIPPSPSADACRRLEGLKRSPLANVKFKNLELNSQGLVVQSNTTKKRVVIALDRITLLSSENDIATSTGHTAITIEYAKKADKGRLVIRGLISKEFLDFIKLLMGHIKRDAIAPPLLQLLEPRQEVHNIDPAVASFIISGFILAMAGLIILAFYPPTIGSTWVYPLLLIPLCLFPLILTIKLQFKKKSSGKRKRSASICAALGFNFGTLGAIAILFILSPASYNWLVADANAMCGRMDVAEARYQQAEAYLSKNSDFLFTFGQFYYKNENWENAARYYIRAYEKDSTNWFAEPLKKIPDSLYKAGLKDEALTWCDTIIQSYSSRPDVIEVIKQKREEIARAVS